MIVLDTPTGLELLFRLRGSIIPYIMRSWLATVGIACAVTVVHDGLWPFADGLTVAPFSLIGIALAIFLGFRNSVSYERFWEGRRLWGDVLIVARNLARQSASLSAPVVAAEAWRRALLYRVIAFAHALRHHLRGSRAAPDLERLLGTEARPFVAARHAPAALLAALGSACAEARRGGLVEPVLIPVLEGELRALTVAMTGCERLANTPIPYPYRLLLHRTVYLYCLLLPFGLVATAGAATPLVVGFLAYAFFGLDAIGEQIEEPFGELPNDLPLEAFCRTLEIDLREALGETALPPPLLPRDDLLL